jgi:hypothetical protein
VNPTPKTKPALKRTLPIEKVIKMLKKTKRDILDNRLGYCSEDLFNFLENMNYPIAPEIT